MDERGSRPAVRRPRTGRLLALAVAGFLSLGWSATTTRHVAWTAVGFFPDDLARQIRRHHRRFDAGLQHGYASASRRAVDASELATLLEAQAQGCARDLRQPIPFADLVERLGVLAAWVMRANDPLAVGNSDSREVRYSQAYRRYVDQALPRVRLVYYGQDRALVTERRLGPSVEATLQRAHSLYPFVGEEFYRTGSLRDWRTFDDRSVAFGVAAVSLSHGLSDLANIASFVWRQGGGRVPTPRPTPLGHVGPTIVVSDPLAGGFAGQPRDGRGEPVMPTNRIVLPTP